MNFEDDTCRLDPMHPSDNECSSDKDGDSSHDKKTKELHTAPAPPARARVRDVERVEVDVDPTLPARARV